MMGDTNWQRYLLSCGLLTVPILAWNRVFARFLPPALGSAAFWREIPPVVTYAENGLRVAVVVLPFLMPLDLSTIAARRSFVLFTAGALMYFAAWIPLMIAPRSGWSTSRAGFLAPAYTPLIWLTGIGLLGRGLFWPSPYRWWLYLALACGFVAAHVAHANIVYTRNA